MNINRGTTGRGLWGRIIIAAVLLLTLAVRIDHAAREGAINPDVIRFIDQARLLGTDPVQALRGEVYHPLHSALTLAVHWAVVGRIVPDEVHSWIISTKVVGILAAVAVGWVIIRMSRRFGAPLWAAAGAGLLWAVGRRASGYGADGMSDMLFLALFGEALLLGMSTRLRWRPGRWLAAGALAGLSYLTRPEGVAAVIILFMSLVLYYGRVHPWRWLREPKHATNRAAFPWSECARCVATLALGFFLVAGTYMAITGHFTGKKSLFRTASAAQPIVAPAARDQGDLPHPQSAGVMPASPLPATNLLVQRDTWQLLGMELWETFGFAPCLVVGLALPLRPRLWGRPHWRALVFVWMGVWFSVMLWLIHTAGYLDGRHTLALQLSLHCLFALSLPLWGKPMQWWQDRWRATPAWDGLPAWRRWRGWPGIFCGGALVLGCLPGMIMLHEAPGFDRSFVRDAAAWLSRNAEPETLLVAESPLLRFYSGLPHHHEIPQTQMAQFATETANRPVVFAYVYQRDKQANPPARIGPCTPVKIFDSTHTLHGDTLVLYAHPDRDGLRAVAEAQADPRK